MTRGERRKREASSLSHSKAQLECVTATWDPDRSCVREKLLLDLSVWLIG